MATVSFKRPMVIKDDKAAEALIQAATCSRKPVDDVDTMGAIERGRALIRELFSDSRTS
jgi:hypothetical protein